MKLKRKVVLVDYYTCTLSADVRTQLRDPFRSASCMASAALSSADWPSVANADTSCIINEERISPYDFIAAPFRRDFTVEEQHDFAPASESYSLLTWLVVGDRKAQ